ncbi:MAG: hypothetical protein WBA93_29905 [Microcoleaceae cyanobacterium]
MKVNIEDIDCGKLPGAFNIFPNIKQLLISCEKLVNYLLLEVGVVLLPRIYGKFGDGYLRLSYANANSIENIPEGISRMKIAIEKFS